LLIRKDIQQQQSHASPASQKNHQSKVSQEARIKQQLAGSSKLAASSSNKVDSSTAHLVERPQVQHRSQPQKRRYIIRPENMTTRDLLILKGEFPSPG
jgi:hypothetical protein